MPRLPRIYAGGLLLLALLALLGPYEPPDSDLWYHLAHGRYIAENHALPTTSYFSFQDPERQWADYYWLFQIAVYAVWQAGGGWLLVVRAAACLGFLFLLWRFLAAEGRAVRSPLWISLLLGLATCATWYRLSILRPHMLSYLAILAALVLCEGPERRRWWLIPVSLAWMNLHGIYFPIVLLLVVAYGGEWLVRRGRGRLESGSLVTPLSMLGVVVTIFATPHGRALTRVPFISTATASHYVGELGRIPWTGLLSYEFQAFVPKGVTAAGILLLLTLVGLVALAWSRKLRVAHLVLALGGILLLVRAGRFTADFSILSLPLLRDLGPQLGADRLWSRLRSAGVLLALLALVPAYARLAEEVDLPGDEPISRNREPAGPAAFVVRVGHAGRVMNDPNEGGYLMWALPRRNPIFMDLEVPFLFHDEDWFEIKSAYDTEFGLRAFLERHRPAFVLGRLDAPDFGRRLARDHPDYRPVYFDDRRVLWADRRQLAAVVEAWEITAADPYELAAGDVSGLGPERRARLGTELARLSAAGDDSVLVAGLRARLALAAGDPRAALDRLREAPRAAADDPWLSGIEAAARSAAGEHAAAVEALRRGLDGARDARAREPLLRSLAAELDLLGRPEEAYRARLEAFGEYNPTAPPEELLELAAAALRAGREDDARELLGRADRELTAEDPRRADLAALRARLAAPHQAMP